MIGEQQQKYVCTERHSFVDSPMVFDQVELFHAHLETCHHVLVPRDDETLEQAVERFVEEHPKVQECSQCRALNMPWTVSLQ